MSLRMPDFWVTDHPSGCTCLIEIHTDRIYPQRWLAYMYLWQGMLFRTLNDQTTIPQGSQQSENEQYSIQCLVKTEWKVSVEISSSGRWNNCKKTVFGSEFPVLVFRHQRHRIRRYLFLEPVLHNCLYQIILLVFPVYTL